MQKQKLKCKNKKNINFLAFRACDMIYSIDLMTNIFDKKLAIQNLLWCRNMLQKPKIVLIQLNLIMINGNTGLFMWFEFVINHWFYQIKLFFTVACHCYI